MKSRAASTLCNSRKSNSRHYVDPAESRKVTLDRLSLCKQAPLCLLITNSSASKLLPDEDPINLTAMIADDNRARAATPNAQQAFVKIHRQCTNLIDQQKGPVPQASGNNSNTHCSSAQRVQIRRVLLPVLTGPQFNCRSTNQANAAQLAG